MSSTWWWDLNKRLSLEIEREVMDIANGGCIAPDSDMGQVAMAYRERVGFVSGLRRALLLAEELESGKERV